MANGMTIDALYEAFMDLDTDDPTPFAEDVFDFFDKDQLGGLGQEAWAAKYGMYLPAFDPAQINLAERERDLAYRDAMNTLETTHAATERVYSTEVDTLSTALGIEMGKGRQMAGRTGLRSGDLEGAIQDTIATTGSKVKDFGDRARISKKEIEDTYNIAMVDAALDFDKTERQEKEEFYDRTMAAIMRLMDTEAFDDPVSCSIDEVYDEELGECRPASDYEVNLQMYDVDPEETIDEHIGDVIDEAVMDSRCVGSYTISCGIWCGGGMWCNVDECVKRNC